MPFAVLNCSSSDDTDTSTTGAGASGGGGDMTTSSGTESSTSSTGGDSTSSAGGDDTTTTTTTAGSGGAGGSTGEGGSSGEGGSTGEGGGDVSSGEFTLTSPSHEDGAKFADKYTCAAAGFNGSLLPELRWTPGPEGTKSYAITFVDRTLTTRTPPSELGYHWVIYDIPANITSLPEELKDAASIGAKQNSPYLGPCPNFNGGNAENHTYEFTIYALATESLTVSGSGTAAVRNAETALEANHLAKAKLTGTSDAAPPR